VTSINELERRLELLAKRMNAEQPSRPGGPLRVLIVTGTLPPGEPLFASAGAYEWIRDYPREDLDAFCYRARSGAIDAGEQRLVIGGLPRTPAQRETARAAYDLWVATEYDPVPPCETSWTAPARRRFGFGD
jgi:hypothetical protein